MEQLYLGFEAFINKLPPMLQLIFGMFIALGTFKLLVVCVDFFQKDEKKDDEKDEKKNQEE